MKRKGAISKEITKAQHYDRHGVLKEIIDEPVEMSLKTELRRSILLGKRKKRLKNISIKVDPLQIQAIKKVAAMKSIPYQILIRHWLSQNLKEELHID
jgi:predicted DNA binding CopG/RHH family protein